MSLERLQGGGLTYLPGQPVPILHKPFDEEVFCNIRVSLWDKLALLGLHWNCSDLNPLRVQSFLSLPSLSRALGDLAVMPAALVQASSYKKYFILNPIQILIGDFLG